MSINIFYENKKYFQLKNGCKKIIHASYPIILFIESLKEGMEQPIKYWSPSIAPSGMTYYDGSLFPEWKNSLFISALVPGDERRLEISNSKILSEEILFLDLGRVRDIATSPDGSLIVATDGAQGKLVRVIKK